MKKQLMNAWKPIGARGKVKIKHLSGVGIILCAEKDDTVVKYSVLKNNKKLFASKYKLYLPTEQELIDELEREKQILRLEAKKE